MGLDLNIGSLLKNPFSLPGEVIRQYKQEQTDIQMMNMIVIDNCGIENDYPYIRLKSGEVFFSYLPTDRERKLYRKYKPVLPANLKEDYIKVALDIVQRYIRENSAIQISPKSHHVFPGDGFFDLGSHIGFGTIKLAKKVGKEGHVIAVEASPEAYELLKMNIEANNIKNVSLQHGAVQDTVGELTFYYSNRQLNSIHNNLKDDSSGVVRNYEKSYKVPAVNIDSLVKDFSYNLDRNTLVSFEINGAELEALKGAKNFIENAKQFTFRLAARYNNANTERDSMKELEDYMSVNHSDIYLHPNVPYLYAYKF